MNAFPATFNRAEEARSPSARRAKSRRADSPPPSPPSVRAWSSRDTCFVRLRADARIIEG